MKEPSSLASKQDAVNKSGNKHEWIQNKIKRDIQLVGTLLLDGSFVKIYWVKLPKFKG